MVIQLCLISKKNMINIQHSITNKIANMATIRNTISQKKKTMSNIGKIAMVGMYLLLKGNTAMVIMVQLM